MALLILWLPAIPAQGEFGDQSLGWTREQEAAVAGYLQRRLQRQSVVINDVWLEYWLTERTQRLRQASSTTLGPVHIAVIKDRSFNAFALPGNVLGFNLGLWRTAHTEAEFMSVVAHEMAHLNLRHFNRLSQNNRQQTWLALSGALLGVALAGVNSDLAGAVFLGSQAGALQKRLAFSRSMESEADRLATELLNDSNYPSTAGAKVFQRLQQEVAYNPDASEYWQTHPRASHRVAQIDTLNENGSSKQATPNHHFDLLRWYVNQRYFAGDEFTKRPESLRPTENEADDDLPTALLAEAEPNLLYGWIWWQSKEHSVELTRQHLDSMTRLFPDFDPAWHQLASLTWQAGAPGEQHCHEALSYLDKIDTPYLQVLELRRTLTSHCRTEREAQATAEWLWYRGEEERAMTLLRRAIETPESASRVARLRELLTHYENQLALLPK